MIVCPRCSKENQDHYKFCLGCGAELPRDAAHAPKSFTAPTPAAGLPVAAPGSGFGAPAQGFGAPAQGFGAPAQGFGAPAQGFGAPAPAQGFGAPAPAQGFGAPAQGFGAPAQGFGAPAPVPSGFGAPAPAPVPSGFGAPAPAPVPSGFGAPAPAPVPSGFGAPAPAPVPSGFGAPAPVAAPKPAQFGGAAAAAPAAGGAHKCPQCATMVPPGFKFCGTCGHDMTAIAAAAAVGAAPTSPAPAPRPAPSAASHGTLTLIRPDGSEGETFPLQEMTVVGRDTGSPFATDSYLSPRHAVFTFKGPELSVADQGSLNGVYVRIERDVPHELEPGAIFRVGQEILRFEPIPEPTRGADGVELMGSPNPGLLGRISLVIGRETTGNAFPIPPGGMHLGRERGDIIFPEDGYVSGLHCRIHSEGGKVVLTDVGSSNGTFTRVRGERTIKRGSLLLMGQQLFRADF